MFSWNQEIQAVSTKERCLINSHQLRVFPGISLTSPDPLTTSPDVLYNKQILTLKAMVKPVPFQAWLNQPEICLQPTRMSKAGQQLMIRKKPCLRWVQAILHSRS